VIPLNPETRKILDAWLLGKKNDFVFYNYETGRLFVDLKAGFKLACKKAGITGVTWHTLRHTFAPRLMERGVDIITVKELLGHSTVTVTMRYTHSNLDSKVAAVGKLAGIFGLIIKCLLFTSNRNSITLLYATHRRVRVDNKTEILRGTLDLMVLQALEAMGPLHGYGIAQRIEQISGESLKVNQGTVYLCLVRLLQKRWIKAEWGTSENNRKARFYSISKAGQKQLIEETENWQRVSDTIGRLLRLNETR
jgi:transcriptional regulator